jgi:GDP-L-fucose synthase
MKILITGGSGFIGRNLKEQYDKNYSVFAPTSSELNLLDENSVSEYLRKYRFDAIIHAANWTVTRTSTKDPTKELDHNLRMFFNLARCSDSFGKMIYFGSGAEFDREHRTPKMKEDYFDTHVPKDQYGFSKYLMAKYAQGSSNIYNLRLFAVFGKYEDWKIRFISNTICNVIYDLPVKIKQNVPSDHVYNVCTGQANDLESLAKIVLEVSRKDLPIKIKEEGLGREYSGDNSKVVNELGDLEFRDIAEGIKELFVWYNSINPNNSGDI